MKRILLTLFTLSALIFISCSKDKTIAKNTPVNDIINIFTLEDQEIFRKWVDRKKLELKETTNVTQTISKEKLEIRLNVFKGNNEYKAGDKVIINVEKKGALYVLFSKLNERKIEKVKENKLIYYLLNKYSGDDVNSVKSLKVKLEANLKNLSFDKLIYEDLIILDFDRLVVYYDKKDIEYEVKFFENNILVDNFYSSNITKVNSVVYDYIINFDKNLIIFKESEKDYFKNWVKNKFSKQISGEVTYTFDISDSKLVAIVKNLDNSHTLKVTIINNKGKIEKEREEIKNGGSSITNGYSNRGLKVLLD